jgi:hypothetical protein
MEDVDIRALIGPPGVKITPNTVRALYAGGGAEKFSNVYIVHNRENGSLRLYRVARQDDEATVLEVRAAFHQEGWLGFTVEDGTVTSATTLGFRPPKD